NRRARDASNEFGCDDAAQHVLHIQPHGRKDNGLAKLIAITPPPDPQERVGRDFEIARLVVFARMVNALSRRGAYLALTPASATLRQNPTSASQGANIV